MSFQDVQVEKSDIEKFDYALEYISRNKKGGIIYDNNTLKKHLVIIHRLQASMVNGEVHEDQTMHLYGVRSTPQTDEPRRAHFLACN